MKHFVGGCCPHPYATAASVRDLCSGVLPCWRGSCATQEDELQTRGVWRHAFQGLSHVVLTPSYILVLKCQTKQLCGEVTDIICTYQHRNHGYESCENQFEPHRVPARCRTAVQCLDCLQCGLSEPVPNQIRLRSSINELKISKTVFRLQGACAFHTAAPHLRPTEYVTLNNLQDIDGATKKVLTNFMAVSVTIVWQ